MLCASFFSLAPLERAETGVTFAALLAGLAAAIKTVKTPTMAPLTMPRTLSPNCGISAHSPATTYFKIAHKAQVAIVPDRIPIGIALLHQFSASNLT